MGASVDRPTVQELSDVALPAQGERRPRAAAPPPRALSRSARPPAACGSAQLAGAAGPMIGISTACTASVHAIGEAFRRIQDGDARMMVAGGYDALTSWLDVLGFALLGALTTEYNDDPETRLAPVRAEPHGLRARRGRGGAWCSRTSRPRGPAAPRSMAEIAGYTASLNAYRMTDPPARRRRRRARDGGRAARRPGSRPSDVDYVVAHGTGTPSGDVSETDRDQARVRRPREASSS